MKTNQVMIRPMGQFKVEQRTKDGFFNATSLLKQWNKQSGQKKQMSHYTDNANTKEFLNALLQEENLKERNSVLLQTRGKTGGTWMHPLAFLDFAMWLNPTFKVKVLKFVADQMLFYRNEAGEAYKRLSSAIARIVAPENMKVAMQQTAEGLNWCIFNNHKSAIRNEHGTEDNQRKLFELERLIATLIEDGFLKSHDEVMNYLRKQWQKVYIAGLPA